jgi:hypothetical protein
MTGRRITCRLSSIPARVFAWMPGSNPLTVPSATPSRVPTRIHIIEQMFGTGVINEQKWIQSYP